MDTAALSMRCLFCEAASALQLALNDSGGTYPLNISKKSVVSYNAFQNIQPVVVSRIPISTLHMGRPRALKAGQDHNGKKSLVKK